MVSGVPLNNVRCEKVGGGGRAGLPEKEAYSRRRTARSLSKGVGVSRGDGSGIYNGPQRLRPGLARAFLFTRRRRTRYRLTAASD